MCASTFSGGTGERILFDFRSSEPQAWHSTDDAVMGGISHSSLARCSDDTAVFTGHVSLENNGGFASVHAPLPPGLLSGCQALELCLRGDGRRYSLRLRQQEAYDGISWRQDFVTQPGLWEQVVLPLEAFEAVFRGRNLPTAGPLEPECVEQIGFLVGRQPGDFALRIKWIKAISQ